MRKRAARSVELTAAPRPDCAQDAGAGRGRRRRDRTDENHAEVRPGARHAPEGGPCERPLRLALWGVDSSSGSAPLAKRAAARSGWPVRAGKGRHGIPGPGDLAGTGMRLGCGAS